MMKGVALLHLRVLTLLLAVPPIVVWAQDGCLTLTVGVTEELTLSSTTSRCFVVPGTASELYRLTIRNSIYGYYSIFYPINEGESYGYAWNSPANGIYYCAQGGVTITFDEYVDGANATVKAELWPSSDCFYADIIGYDGYVPIETPPNGVTTEVYWSSHRYYLHAMHFEYQVQGEERVTMENLTRSVVTGDPGSDTYCSMEVTWLLNGLEKRLYAYMEANQTSWRITEMRVYDETEEWAYFYDPGIDGDLETCFTANNVTISNNEGSEIRFQNLELATFLPWLDEPSFLDCIGRDPGTNQTASSNTTSGACALMPLVGCVATAVAFVAPILML